MSIGEPELLREFLMDDSEVNLFRMVNTVWKNKKQVLFFTFLITISAVSFAFVQPKQYEVHKIAFVLTAEKDKSKLKSNWPLEYYEKYFKNPEILNSILENLPKEVKFEDNIAPLIFLSEALRVESAFVPADGNLTFPAIKFICFVRHKDSFSAHKIADTWQNILDRKFIEIELNKVSKKEEQLKLNKGKWDEAKKRLSDFKNKNSAINKKMELDSVRRTIVTAHRDSEALARATTIVGPESVKIGKYKAKLLDIEEMYLTKQVALSESKRLLALQPQMLSFSGHPKIGSPEFRDSKNNGIINPVHIKLQEDVIESEVLLKTLDAQKVRLENKIHNLELDLNSKSQRSDGSVLIGKKSQLEKLTEKIKQYEQKSGLLENLISEMNIEKKKLVQQEIDFAKLVSLISQELEELKLLKAQKAIGLSFASSPFEPARLLGTPLGRVAYMAFGSGLIFMILLTLIKAGFSSGFANELNSHQNNTSNSVSFSENIASNEGITAEEKTFTSSNQVSDSWKETKPQFSAPS
jgi:hypothetical protein